jgi:signal peptidase I
MTNLLAAFWKESSKEIPKKKRHLKYVGTYVVSDGENIEIQTYYDYRTIKNKDRPYGWEYMCKNMFIETGKHLSNRDKKRLFIENDKKFKVKEVKYWLSLNECLKKKM